MITGKNVKKALKGTFTLAKNHAKLTSGEMLRIIREKNALSQAELAEKTGLKQSTISSLENNRISLGAERARVLARVLKVHPAVLVFPDWHQGSAA